MYTGMPTTKAERVHIRIEDDIKEGAIAVVKLRGLGNLTALVTSLLKEEINQEIQDRPDLFADALKKVKTEASGVKRSVPIGSPANIADRNYANRKPQEHKTLAKKRSRKR